MTEYWLGVVQREHVLRGVELGIAQANHGAKTGILRMSPGDGMVYYSPKTAYPTGDPLKAFTAVGTIADGEPWQGEEGDFHPWRRAVDWDRSAVETPIAPLLTRLDLSRDNANWGYQLRRGHLGVTAHDFALIAAQMGSDIVVG